MQAPAMPARRLFAGRLVLMAQGSVAQSQTQALGEGLPAKTGLVYPRLKIPFILLIACFAAWGSAANLTDVLVGVFRSIFTMTNFESALVQFAYYGAYFSLAIPAAMINRRWGYKTGVLTGLGLASLGGLLFIPASNLLEFLPFLIALFVLAAGLSILETSANPFVIAMGPEASATQRLNLAQAFNPVGANIGVLLGAVVILPQITTEAAKTIMSAEELRQSQEHDLGLVLGPYLGITAVLVLIWVSILVSKMPTPTEPKVEVDEAQSGAAGRLWRNRHYRYGVAAQFFNVAAQVCAWSFTIQYARDVVGVPAEDAGWYLQASLILFLIRPEHGRPDRHRRHLGVLVVDVPDDLRGRSAGAGRGHQVRRRRARDGHPRRGDHAAGPGPAHGRGGLGHGVHRPGDLPGARDVLRAVRPA
jgi:MFS transporter, FHS family, L-fucose permease